MLVLDPQEVDALFQALGRHLGQHAAHVDARPIEPAADRAPWPAIAQQGMPLGALLALARDQLDTGMIHVSARRYFGLFNPAPTPIAALADALVAVYNPQLASYRSAPALLDAEETVLRWLAAELPYPAAERAFTSGGAESNGNAVLAALYRAHPEVKRDGVRALERQPTLYVSREAHASLRKAAVMFGLGERAVREVAVDTHGAMRLDALTSLMAKDKQRGARPFLVVATLGTTTSGAIDDIEALAELCRVAGTWLHVDAAYGAALALVTDAGAAPPWRRGLTLADSVTLDAHKMLFAPVGCGVFLSRHAGVLREVFGIRAPYMPKHNEDDPYARGAAWSRRAIGLKVLLQLYAFGAEGIRAAMRHTFTLGDYLRRTIAREGWETLPATPLPIVGVLGEGATLAAMRRAAVERAEAWTSVARLSSGRPVLRACVTNHRSTHADVDALVDAWREGLGAAARVQHT